MAIPSSDKKYSYADYLTWSEGERIELIAGQVYNMSPAPSRLHQQVLGELFTAFSVFLKDKECKVFFAPFDVRLLTENKNDAAIDNVVQPDLSVICDRKKLDDRGCNGAPDLIVEVLSPSSAKMDRWNKYQLYEKAGVKEYWLVDPANESVEIYLLTDVGYKLQGIFTKEDTVSVQSLPGLELDLSHIFE
ncbi:Uma2 family endonuclease [Oceanobacillus alkalisoli]|uniref:Uma2 family endonuclease n=1 Tax=Oceanobacillus alkalisoli TaxID=2925113 RepID=UPI001EE3C939|nr:Uma2 family endonuclease [Oceanobacillus alkalisoli]MCG5103388.1 Uma2 family endonuclease [Oceanobacillus alkalisoli]